jgi:hypothetical protein
MSTQLIPEDAPALNVYDDKSFIKAKHSHRLWPNDPTCIVVFPATRDRGTQFEPFNVPRHEFHIATLPPTPLELFQLFVPISLVEKWVHYTKICISWLKANEWVDSWKRPMGRILRLRTWEGTYASEIYLFIAILIYMGIHIERTLKTYWSSPQPGLQSAEHLFIKFMPYWKFQLMHHHLRPFDHTKIGETGKEHLPEVFQGVEEWSNHIQAVSAELLTAGSHLTVDECMVSYTGKCGAKTTVKGKPEPVGVKIWVIAQQGFFLRWLWHIRDAIYGPVGIELPQKKSSTRSQGRGASKAAGKELAREEKPIALNPTQAVVITLANLLPKATYHIFIDNLFSSSGLLRSLRKHGHGAIGTARKNSGIYKELAEDKGNDGKVKRSYEFNKVKAIPTPDNKVSISGTFTSKIPTNLLSFYIPRSTISPGKTISLYYLGQPCSLAPIMSELNAKGGSRRHASPTPSQYANSLVTKLSR